MNIPVAWILEVPGLTPALYHDMGQALANQLKVGGVVSPLYRGAPLPVPQDQAQDARRIGNEAR
jgi:hypothetical protein